VARESGRTILVASGLKSFVGDVGVEVEGVCGVTALLEPGLDPAAGASVRYQVVDGPLELGRGRAGRRTVRTDATGSASIAATFTGRGGALVMAELVDDPTQDVFFAGRSEGTVERLLLAGGPFVSADAGVVVTRVLALDHRERPVTGARLSVDAVREHDTAIRGTVRARGRRGVYEARVPVDAAGEWTVSVQDAVTRVHAERVVHVEPGGPDRIEFVGETNPRASPPYGELDLRARLVDRTGNALDPARLRCLGPAGEIRARWAGDGVAVFPVRSQARAPSSCGSWTLRAPLRRRRRFGSRPRGSVTQAVLPWVPFGGRRSTSCRPRDGECGRRASRSRSTPSWSSTFGSSRSKTTQRRRWR
jgi:hypothetical protein